MTSRITICGHEKHHAHGLCSKCYDKQRDPQRYNHNKEVILERHRKKWRQDRIEVIAYYGNKCACCGESNLAFLTIDHINNDGAKHKRELGGKSNHLYRWLRLNSYPPGFQVLCYNCNCAKQYNPGGCPHVRTV